MPTTTLPYRYTHASTESMTGYFSCEPPEDLCFEDALARLEAAPLDEFLHRHLLRRIAALPPDEAAALRTPSRPVLMGLLYETAFLNAGHAGMLNGVSAGELERLEGATPLPYLSFARKSLTKEGQEEQANLAAWNALFEENLSQHISLEMISETVHMTENYVSRLFKSESGMNVVGYINMEKMEQARRILSWPESTVRMAAGELGYYESSYFIKLFRKTYGIGPGEYKKFAEDRQAAPLLKTEE